jgi:hypothetical protein
MFPFTDAIKAAKQIREKPNRLTNRSLECKKA